MVIPCSTLTMWTSTTEKTVYCRLSRSWEGRQGSLSAPVLTITITKTENHSSRSWRELSLHDPKEADAGGGEWGFLPGVHTFHVAPEHLLMLENTDVNRKAKEVEWILLSRFSELTFAKITHAVDYLHVNWSWKYASLWKPAVRWTGVSPSSPGRFPNIYISSSYSTLILFSLPSSQAEISTKLHPKSCSYTMGANHFYKQKMKIAYRAKWGRKLWLSLSAPEGKPSVQSAQCQRWQLVLKRRRKNDSHDSRGSASMGAF